MMFPETRLRRLRYNSVLRDMVTETKLSVDDLVMPLFVSRRNQRAQPNQFDAGQLSVIG